MLRTSSWQLRWVADPSLTRANATKHCRPVTLGSTGTIAGQRIQQYVRDAMLAAAERTHVQRIPLVRVFGADASTVYFQHVLTGDAVVVEDASALVLALGHEPVDDLVAALAEYPGDVYPIGDCLTPRTVEEAVLEGLSVGAAV